MESVVEPEVQRPNSAKPLLLEAFNAEKCHESYKALGRFLLWVPRVRFIE
jgi:hypothetical protein